MPLRDDQATLRQMLAHAREALGLVAGKRRADLDHERVLALALIQLLQIVGEAAGRVSPAFCDSHPQIPWSQIVSLRNRLIHGYDVIDLDIVWSILLTDVPNLITELERLTDQ
jgi:uncharacterized protein with HEPN domain